MRPRIVVLTVIVLLLAGTVWPGERGGGGISGFVTRHGFPLEARVELRRFADGGEFENPLVLQGPALASVPTDENGAFRFDGLGQSLKGIVKGQEAGIVRIFQTVLGDCTLQGVARILFPSPHLTKKAPID